MLSRLDIYQIQLYFKRNSSDKIRLQATDLKY